MTRSEKNPLKPEKREPSKPEKSQKDKDLEDGVLTGQVPAEEPEPVLREVTEVKPELRLP